MLATHFYCLPPCAKCLRALNHKRNKQQSAGEMLVKRRFRFSFTHNYKCLRLLLHTNMNTFVSAHVIVLNCFGIFSVSLALSSVLQCLVWRVFFRDSEGFSALCVFGVFCACCTFNRFEKVNLATSIATVNSISAVMAAFERLRGRVVQT